MKFSVQSNQNIWILPVMLYNVCLSMLAKNEKKSEFNSMKFIAKILTLGFWSILDQR